METPMKLVTNCCVVQILSIGITLFSSRKSFTKTSSYKSTR